MDVHEFSRAADRSDSLSVKWNRDAIVRICNNPDALPFWVADMDFPVPMEVRQALHAQADHGVLGYPWFTQTEQTFVRWAQMRHRWQVDPSLTVATPGMLSAIATLVELYSQEGDGVVLPMPAYKPFVHIIRGLGRKVVAWPMTYEHTQARFSLDIASLDRLLDRPHTPLILFCSPHNPTGRVFAADELEAVAQAAVRRSVTVISDEIHADLTYAEAAHIPFDVIAKRHALSCATCMAPSKSFNIAGEHFALVVCSDSRMRHRLSQRLHALHIAPDLLATVTATAAYAHGYGWLKAMRAHLSLQAQEIRTLLAESGTGLRFVTPEASFIGLIDCSAIMERVQEDADHHPGLYDPAQSPEGGLLSRFFGQRAGIAMNDGSWFGSAYGNFVRFNYGTSGNAVKQAIGAIIDAVKSLS